MTIVLAVLLGSLFGFILHRVGASNPQNIINMLRLKDLHLMKAILLAIGLSTIVLFMGLAFGIINNANLSVKAAYSGVLAGGAIFGLGFALAGYCPGTALAALGEGRKDALSFVLGGLVGAGLLMGTYRWLQQEGWFDSWFGGKVTLAQTDMYESILTAQGNIVPIIIGLLFVGVAVALNRLAR